MSGSVTGGDIAIKVESTADELIGAVVAHLKALPAGAVPFLIVPSSRDVASWRHLLADGYPGRSFGLTVTTLADHVVSRWGLHGDGRGIVEGGVRTLLMAKALEGYRTEAAVTGRATDALPLTAGVVQTLAAAAREGFCRTGFDDAVTELSRSGQAAFQVIGRYRDLLERDGKVEYGEALSVIASSEFRNVDICCVGLIHPLPAEADYFAKVGATMLALERGGDPDAVGIPALVAHLYHVAPRLAPGSSVRFASASGVNVEAALIADIVSGYVASGVEPDDVFVACANPSDVFGRVAPILLHHGIVSCGACSKTFASSPLGQAFLELRAVVHGLDGSLDRVTSLAALNDFARSPFARVDREEVLILDRRFRGNRSLALPDYLAKLSRMDGGIARLVELFTEGDDVSALATLHAAGLASSRLDALDRRLDAGAFSKGSAFLAAAHACELDDALMMSLLSRISLSATYRLEPSPDAGAAGTADGLPASTDEPFPTAASALPAVRFGTLDDLAAGGCRIGIIAQMTAADLPLTTRGDPLRSLFALAGIEREDTRLADTRLRFREAVASVEDAVVFERALNDANAAFARPSVLFEEVIDCFRDDITATDDLDEATGLPSELIGLVCDGVPICIGAGEEKLSRLVPMPFGSASTEEDSRPTVMVGQGIEDRISTEEALRLVTSKDGEPLFSATQVESYLDCPYKWFVQRKIRPNPLDEQTDEMLYGSFIHKVLERFYIAFGKDAPRRVTDGNRAEAVALLDRIFDELRDDPSHDDPRLSVENKLEDRELEQKRMRLHDMLAGETVFLPGFTPARFEEDFGSESKVLYAGYPFHGKIDRIDMDAKGHAVIIDYKGSLQKSFSPAVDEHTGQMSAPHVQAMIYAAIVHDLLDLDVVGSLYRSYKDGQVQGAYDGLILGPEEVCSKEAFEAVGNWNLPVLLETTEGLVRAGIERMLSGDISRDPTSGDSCMYCPVAVCSRKQG